MDKMDNKTSSNIRELSVSELDSVAGGRAIGFGIRGLGFGFSYSGGYIGYAMNIGGQKISMVF